MISTLRKPSAAATELVRKLRQTNSIPALDENVSHLCQLTDRSETSTADLTTVIMRDAGLTSRLLAMANSAAYRPRNPVKTVSSAVILFGFDRVRQLAVGLSLFQKHSHDVRDKELYRLLVCAYCTGIFAMDLARRIRDENPEELFVIGLLHQLPRLVLFNGFPDKYRNIDRLIVQKKMSLDRACNQVFGAGYEDLAAAMAEHWNLPKSHHAYSGEAAVGAHQRRLSVRLAVEIADMLFGNSPAGPVAAAELSAQAASLLDRESFSLPDFVGDTVEKDPNMEAFFRLSKQDISMMARIAEWGKVSSADVANTLTQSFEHHASAEVEKDAPLVMAHFLSELMIAVRNRTGINEVLMLAQEGIFRCLKPNCVITAFVTADRTRLQGRLYAGQNPYLQPGRYQLQLNADDCLAAQNMQGKDVIVASAKNKRILPNDSLIRELGIDSVLLAPICARDQAIGQFFLGRQANGAPFSADDCLWMVAISGHVALAFESVGKN